MAGRLLVGVNTVVLSGLGPQMINKATDLSVRSPCVRLVLADEPTGNLDTQTADQRFELLRELRTG